MAVNKARRLLRRLGLKVGAPLELTPLDPDRAGRCSKVRVGGPRGRVVSAQRLRKVLGFDLLKSAIFDARVEGDELVLEGRGYGHGVGMCQWGAEGMAEDGKTFQEILSHYYPGTRLERAY